MENSLVKKRRGPQRLLSWIWVLYAVATTVCYLLPYTQFVLPYMFMALLMLASFFMVFDNVKLFKYSVCVIVMSLVLMFTVLIMQKLSIVTGINNAIREMRFFIPVLWGMFFLKNTDVKQRKIILVIYFAVTVLVVFKTLQALEIDPMIVRVLAQDKTRGTTEINAYRLNNVAGYSFSYMMGVVVICATWIAVNASRRLVRVISVLVVIVSFHYIIETMYATLLILSVLGVVLVLFVHSKNAIGRIALIILGLVALFFMEEIMAWLSDVFSFSRVLHIKFNDIHNAIKYGDVSEVGSRPQLMLNALENWVRSPLFGSSEANHAHSTFFSVLQESGLVGISLWIGTLAFAISLIVKKLKSLNVDVRMFGLSVAYLVTLSVFNDIRMVYELSIAVFFIVPILSVYMKEKSEQHKAEL